MVKYGKYYRGIHIAEFQDNYIDYKKLKQKIKTIKNSLPQFQNNSISISLTSASSIKFRTTMTSIADESMQENDKENENFLIFLNEFKKLLNEEFQRFFNFFISIQKQLYRKLNRHLYTQTNYISYNLNELLEEVTNIRKTIYLAKCLNEFINDNMTAIKKILKKFDKKFHIFYGNFGPKYILDKLTIENSDMEYLLQFKVIDETSTICESNLKLLNKYFKEYCLNNKVSIEQKNEFERKRNSIYKYIKDIDEIIYFRIQYKEWFYFTKKNVQIISESKLFKNLMFNPILFSAYHKDDLMNKFLSRKDQIKEVEKMQISMASVNKKNITLILIHHFFYNTLISGIYPLLFELVGETKENEFIPYSLLIIASTYFFSYFSIMLNKCLRSKRIKESYLISYIFFMLGSSAYIFSYQKNLDKKLFKLTMLGCLIFSRVIIGLGANPTIGKNYILNYSSKYFLPYISKIYVFISILGHSFGPLIGFFLYNIPDKKLLTYLHYSKFNCIGWYGFIFSFILFIINIMLFTSPKSEQFLSLDLRKSQILYLSSNSKGQNVTPFLDNDIEDSQDKEFYKLQKEKIIENNEDNVSVEDNNNIDIKEKSKNKESENVHRIKSVDNEKYIDIEDKDETIDIYKSGNSQIEGEEKSDYSSKNKNNSDIKNISTEIKKQKDKKENFDPNPLFISIENLEQNNIEYRNEEEGSFTDVNMIPRAIDEILRKEKTTFSYLNKNLLMILFTLFFNSLLKENYIGYCSYYIYHLISSDEKKNLISAEYLSLFISVSYFLEIFSMLFILPLYRLNKLIKKFFIILMCLSLLLMVPISIIKLTNIYFIYLYFAIISLIFLISSIIEVLSSCYLAYLTPPEWKFGQFNAGMLPLIIMTFGKLSGCLICLVAFFKKLMLNYYIILGLTFVGYGISSIFILKSKNFRIKAIARIMRKAELEQNYI